MEYVNRLLEKKLASYWESFPCVLVAGARQVGKSTLVEQLYGNTCKIFVFDPVQDLYAVKDDPDLFLRNNPPPLILDEIQYVPELVPALKRYIDRNRRPGMFLITGSQQWEVMRHLSESLAGRAAFLELPGFSLQEKGCVTSCWLNRWMEAAGQGADAAFESVKGGESANISATEHIWKGSFPEVRNLKPDVVSGWMQGYVNTYLQRDVRLLTKVRDETQFARFLSLCASLTGQECNYSQIGRDIHISTPTAIQWLSILRATYQWLEVPAFASNHIKRLSEKPKGYFCDTGLAAYLMRISSPEAVQGHPAFGALFETMVVQECYKQVQQQSLTPVFHHYRLHSGAEIDLILEKDGVFFPVEIKAGSTPGGRSLKNFDKFRDTIPNAAQAGLIIYAGREVLRLNDYCTAVPFDLNP